MEYLALPAYGLYLGIIIFGAAVAVRSASLIRALLGLVLTLFGVAGMYFLMSAPFMALMQLLIYVGAVAVLIFFAIMLTRDGEGEAGAENSEPRPTGRVFQALAAGCVPALVLAAMVTSHPAATIALKPETPLAALGDFLFGPYVMAFELISVALFAAMAGAVLLGFERRKGK